MPRFYCPLPLTAGAELELPAGAARHVQVLRLQPGDTITLFDGAQDGPGGEWQATITRMSRSDVAVRIDQHVAADRENTRPVHLLAGITANERMDWLVEKATELGVTSITPCWLSAACSSSRVNVATRNARTGRPWPWPPASSAAATVRPSSMKQ